MRPMPATPASRLRRNSARELPFGAVRPTPVITMRADEEGMEAESTGQLGPKSNTRLG